MPAINSVPLVVAEEGVVRRRGGTRPLELFQSQMYREAALQSHAIDGTVSDLINAIQGWSRGADTIVTSATEGGLQPAHLPPVAAAGHCGLEEPRGQEGPHWSAGIEHRVLRHRTPARGRGVDPRVQLVPIVQVPALEMLLAGQVEAACLPEPLCSTRCCLAAPGASGIPTRLGAPPGCLLFRRGPRGEERRDRRLLPGIQPGGGEVNANPAASVPAIVADASFPDSEG